MMRTVGKKTRCCQFVNGGTMTDCFRQRTAANDKAQGRQPRLFKGFAACMGVAATRAGGVVVCPFFDGKRIYYRTESAIYAIEAKMQLRRNPDSHCRSPHRTIILWGMLFCCPAFAIAEETPLGQSFGWRGDESGRFPEATPPLEWDGETGKNILWRTKIGISKFSSPVFVKGKVFVVAEPARLICVDAENGEILWEKANGFDELPVKAEPEPARGEQGNTTPTPCSDGQFVYATFGSGIVACYDLNGARQWIQYIDAPPGLEFGRSCSPVLFGDKLLVSVHHLFALDVKTGKVMWTNENVSERYGTPAAIRIGGVEMALTPSGQIVRISDGKVFIPALLWRENTCS